MDTLNTVEKPEPAKRAKRSQPKELSTREELLRQKRVKIVIPSTGRQNEENPVYVGVNGYKFLIQRGKEVEVPIAVCEVLDHAIETHYDQVKDEQGRVIDLRPRDSQKYPYRIVQ